MRQRGIREKGELEEGEVDRREGDRCVKQSVVVGVFKREIDKEFDRKVRMGGCGFERFCVVEIGFGEYLGRWVGFVFFIVLFIWGLLGQLVWDRLFFFV